MSSRIVHKWTCTFEGGRPILDRPQEFKQECQALDGKRGFISVHLGSRMKSNEQNRYYRGVVVQRFAEYWGCTNEEAHEALSRKHLTVESDNPEMPARVRSTRLSEWSTAEWEQYMEHLRRWGLTEFGLYIEEPNEVDMTSIGRTYY